MKVQVKHALKADVATAFKLCTELKSQEAVYARLGGSDVRVKRAGRAPNVQLQISRRMPANPPAALKRIVPATNEVAHTEAWSAEGDGYTANIVVEIKGVPVKIAGTKKLHAEKSGCTVAWAFDITSGIPLLGSLIAAFAGAEIEKNLQDEFKVLKASL